MTRVLAFTAILLGLLGACSVGGLDAPQGDDDVIGGDDDGEVLVERYTLTASPADQTVRLAEPAAFTLALASENFAGQVTLAVAGLPTTWTATFTPSATVELVANGQTDVTLTISGPSSEEAVAAALSVTATGSKGEVVTQTSLTVLPELIVPIAAGTGDGPHGFQDIAVHAGTTIRFTNDDSTGHRIHANDDGAIEHQDATMGPGQSYDVVVTAGESQFYCHDHGDGSGIGNLVVLP
jgi:plastocyanin